MIDRTWCFSENEMQVVTLMIHYEGISAETEKKYGTGYFSFFFFLILSRLWGSCSFSVDKEKRYQNIEKKFQQDQGFDRRGMEALLLIG